MCMQSFKSIDNKLAKISERIPTEREGVEKYQLRERVNINVFFC